MLSVSKELEEIECWKQYPRTMIPESPEEICYSSIVLSAVNQILTKL